MKKYLLGLIILSINIGMFSCKKNADYNNPKTINLNDEKVYLPQTEQEKKTVELIKITKELIKIVYQDKEAIKEVNALIVARVYPDEHVFLKDLLSPETSDAYKCKQMNYFLPKIKKGTFAKRFKEALDTYNGNHNAQSKGIIQYYIELFASSDITIYFPYSKNFITNFADFNNLSVEQISLCAADRDANSEMGDEPEIVNQILNYKDVLIDDGYAEENATNIIGKNDDNNGIRYLLLEEPNPWGDNPTPTPTEKPNNYSLLGRRVYLGWTKCTHQYDHFISFTGNGGGSEMRYCRISGYQQIITGGSVSNFEDQINVQIDRKDIRNSIDKRIYAIWDPNWKDDNLEQVYAIWEEDNKGTVTFTGSVTVGPGTIGYNFTKQSQDAIVRQLKWSRADYLGDALNDQGCGFVDNYWGENWPWYDCSADVTWTFPFSTF